MTSGYGPQIDRFSSTFTNSDRPAAIFVAAEKILVLPRVGGNLLPGKDPVFPWCETIEMSAARRIGAVDIVEVEPLTAWRVGNEDNGCVDDRLLQIVDDQGIERSRIQADDNFKLPGP